MNHLTCDECENILDMCEVEEALLDGKHLCDICRVLLHGGLFSDDDADAYADDDELTVVFTPDDDY